MKDRVCVGVVGAGIISDIYLKNMTARFENLQVKSVSARRVDKAMEKASQYGLFGCSVDDMMSDPEIDLIVNRTPVGAHEEIIRKALESGKNVYTEKTMTDRFESAAELCRLADQKGLSLGSAPDTFLGSSLQSARRAIDQGILGMSPVLPLQLTATMTCSSVCSPSAVFPARGSAWISESTM